MFRDVYRVIRHTVFPIGTLVSCADQLGWFRTSLLGRGRFLDDIDDGDTGTAGSLDFRFVSHYCIKCKNSDLSCQTMSDFDGLEMAGSVRTSPVLQVRSWISMQTNSITNCYSRN